MKWLFDRRRAARDKLKKTIKGTSQPPSLGELLFILAAAAAIIYIIASK